jgi:excisionase family DNA binding protein
MFVAAMGLYSTTQAAKRLGIGVKTLSRYIANKKVPAPAFLESGQVTHHVWTEEQIEHVRKLLPNIADGRKTRHQKKQLAASSKQAAKTKKK